MARTGALIATNDLLCLARLVAVVNWGMRIVRNDTCYLRRAGLLLIVGCAAPLILAGCGSAAPSLAAPPVFNPPAAQSTSAPRNAPRPTSDVFAETITPYLQAHCVKCHGAEKQEAELRLDQLSADFSQHHVAETWAEVRDRLNLGEMPPEEEPQPKAQATEHVAGWIANQLQAATAAARSTGGRTVVRRLNRAEYNNTIRDLVDVDFRPADNFPEDPPAHGFDNVGAALTVSPLHIEQYLQAAREVVDRALVTGSPAPKQRWRFVLREAEGGNDGGKNGRWLQKLGPGGRAQTYGRMHFGANPLRNGAVVLRQDMWNRKVGFQLMPIPYEGQYIVRIRAASHVPDRATVVAAALAQNQAKLDEELAKANTDADKQKIRDRWDAHIWPDVKKHFATESIYNFGPPRLRLLDLKQTILAEADVDAPEGEPREYVFHVHFAAGDGGLTVDNDYRIPKVLENFWFQGRDEFPRPELLIEWIELEGPVEATWPRASYQRLLGGIPSAGDPTARARAVLARFMPRAFRRPISPAELDAMLALFQQSWAIEPNFEEAIKTPLVAVLASPHFLYLVEPGDEAAARPLNDFEIASRLSYFLWSSLPDDALFALADAGQLRDPQVLRQQVDRMLADPKAAALVTNFAGQWIGLRQLGANPPTENLFPRYDPHLEKSFRGESEAFFAEILHHDLSVMNFVRSDFVTINERLARFYGIDGVRGDHFRRVAVPEGVRRGGLLTQGSMLTITSNGTRTSPVIRGKWILENILGTPPAPPPPDVGDIAPKVPGIDKATVRVRLEAHRKLAQCASCHNKIDPLGFALENFNADGRWRDQEGFGYNGRVNRDDPAIDASGRLPDGREFNGVAELQALLLAEEDRFLNCLTEKLLVYALGRGLEYTDRPTRDHCVAQLKQNGYTLRGLIQEIVVSEPFLTK